MKKTVTFERLNDILLSIRNFIWDYPYKTLQNVIFIDENSFYSYMENEKINNKTIKELMEEIEGCIPFSLTDKSHEIFMSALYSKSEREAEIFCEEFKRECKVNFIKELRLLKSDIQFKNLVELCQKIREENSNFDFILERI